MSSVLYGLGRAAFRRRWVVLVSWLVALLVVAGAAATMSKPFDDNFSLPGTESQEGLDALSHTFPQVSGVSAQIIVVAPEGETVNDPELRAAIEAAVERLTDLDETEAAVSPFDENVDGAVSDDERAALINVQFDGQAVGLSEETKDAVIAEADRIAAAVPGTEASPGGAAFQEVSIGLSIIDAVGVLVALIVLWVTLGSLIAAGLPLATAIWGVGISTLAIVAGTAFVAMNSATIMLGVMLGLAVGIDYALFILSRHRDQLRAGVPPEESAARAVATSGSAVVFAGLTVMIALAGLVVAGIPFLTTMGFAASIAVGLAVLIAITVLPAFMGLMGDRLRPKPKKGTQAAAGDAAAADAPGTPAGAAAPEHQPETPPVKKTWAHRWVGMATKVPVLTVLIIVVGLGALAFPASTLKLALPDAGDNAAGSPTRVTYDLVSEHFGPGHNGPLIMTVDIVASDDPLGVMEGIKEKVEAVPGVAEVPLATPNPTVDTGIVQIIPTTAGDDPETVELVHRLRALAPEIEDEFGVTTRVTGITAIQIDVSEQLGKALVPFAILVVGLSLILLTIVFRSLWVPLKAAVGYLFSVIAAFGVVALVFEHGVGASLLGLDKTGPVISFLPIILMGILFGLAMDYEVFLVSRIREEHVHGVPAREAIKSGFVASARVVLAAGLIMFAVFAAFVPEGDAMLQSIALGLAVGIFVDAFIVRMTLVPAVLHLLGEKAWYLPKWLDRILPSFDVEGEGLQRRLALADWPRAGQPLAVAAEGLSIDGTPILPASGLYLEPGQAAILTGGDAQRRTAALLALTGRTSAEGRLKLGALVLPEQGSAARRRSRYLDAVEDDLVDAVVGADRGKLIMVAIDRADQLGPDATTRLTRMVAELQQRGVAVVISSGRPLAGFTGAQVVDLDRPAVSPNGHHPGPAPSPVPAYPTPSPTERALV